MNKFAEKFKELRLEKKLSQEDISAIFQCKQSCISKWERGATEPSFDELIKISKFFKASTDYLLGEED